MARMAHPKMSCSTEASWAHAVRSSQMSRGSGRRCVGSAGGSVRCTLLTPTWYTNTDTPASIGAEKSLPW